MRVSAVFCSVLLALLAASCQTAARQEARLAPRRSTVEIRLDEIRRQIDANPVRAIDLIHTYRVIYRVTEGYAREPYLLSMEEEATQNLRNLLGRAVAEGQWEQAISLGRSLANIERTDISEWEPDFTLALARKQLDAGDNLNAFLTAARAHRMRPIPADCAMLFLLRAVEGRQRGTAAFFYAALERAGAAGTVPPEAREFARGMDTPTDMIRGVATVIVDRGMRAERGRIHLDRAFGSAFFVDASGLLITNYHVISSEVDPAFRGNSRMFIRIGDATSPRIPARVVGWDKTLDLALISAPIRSDFVFSVVNYGTPNVGDTILAMGSPIGILEQTVTSGIVSSLSRRILQIGDFMQIDAAVNPGNSGGPVVDTFGRLVGVVFAGMMQAQGLNFAIPAERLAAALPAMTRGGRAERPWLGTVLSETFSGAEIIYTAPNTPVSRHHVPEGSMIRSVNGQEVRASQGRLIPAMQDTIFQLRPGELVALETLENGEVRRRLMMTATRPELPLVNAARVDSRERLATPFFGMVLAPTGIRSWIPRFQVERVVRGFAADELGVSEQDIVAIRNFHILERYGVVLMEMNIRKRNMAFMETGMTIFAPLDSPDTF
ncbi:MAG: trypsin-like peptidase domain-containing protein [Treponema sp.]|nr:trypsin-like peptidase domain-containing protein [Treponema sp.]